MAVGRAQLPAIQKVREAAGRVAEQNNLKMFAMAFIHYHDVMGKMPAAGSSTGRTAGAKPMLSWRVAVLPYVEQDDLYKQFKLDEPWDSPHNIRC